MTLEKRLEKLEKATGGGERPVIMVQYEGSPEPSEAEKAAAIEAYRAKHPDRDLVVLYWDGRSFGQP